jgi:hypothetical protein
MTGQTETSTSGDWLYKVGITTGWTYGDVQGTCEEIEYNEETFPDSPHILCADLVDLQSEPGDSGSPVFTYSGTLTSGTGTMRGILIGEHDTDLGDHDSWIVSISTIENDLQVSLLAYNPPSPIAQISGPTSVRTGMECTWSASGSTGYGTKSYEWKWNGSFVGDEVEYTRIVSSSGTLSLKVTDDIDRTDSTSIEVTASANGPTPPQCTF